MSFVRLTPETAFPRVQQLLDELSAVVERAERLVPLPTLADGLQQVRTYEETLCLEVALCLAAPLDPAALLTVLRWLAAHCTTEADIATQVTMLPTSLSTQVAGWDITVRLFAWDQPPRYRVGAVRAPLLLILGDAAMLADERTLVALKALCRNHPYVMLVSLPGDPLAPACVEALRHETWELETHALDALPDTGLLERVLTSPIVDILRAHVLLRAGRALAEAVKAHLDEEHNSLKDLQEVFQTRFRILQQAELHVLPKLQNHLNQLRDWLNLCRNPREACTTLLHVPQREEVWPAYESRLPAVTALDQTPREESLETRLPQHVLDEVQRELRRLLKPQMLADLHALQNFYQQVTAGVQAALQEAGSSLPVLPPPSLLESNVDEVLESAVRLEREQVYKGTLRKRSPWDYVKGLGSQLLNSVKTLGTTVLVVFLGPLFLSNESAKSVGEQLLESGPLRIVIGLGFGMLIVVVHDAWKIPRERKRAERQALDNALQALRQAGQKLPAACQEAWCARLAGHLSTTLIAMQSTLEQALATYRQTQTQARESLQQRQRDAGARDETLAAVLGLRLTSEPDIKKLHSTLDQIQVELRRLLGELLRPAPRPGARL